jgi:biotin carboxylase
MSRKTVLILGASRYQLDAIRTARRLGYRVITTDNVPSNPGHALADRSFTVDTTDQDAVLDIARRERIDGVIAPATDVAVCTACYIAEHLGLPGPPLEAAVVVSSKLLTREFMAAQGLPSVEAYPLLRENFRGGELFRRAPWIVKPNRSSGSKGVFIVRSQAELDHRIPETLSFSIDGRGIIERYIEGFQGTCEGVLRDGRVAFSVVLDRQTAMPPYVATWGHNVPSRLPLAIRARLGSLIENFWGKLKVRQGPFDCDFVASDGEVYILEMSPRIGGNSISRLLLFACGFDLVEYGIRQACGDEVSLPSQIDIRPSAIVLLGSDEAGRFTYNRDEANALRREPWVERISFDIEIGALVLPFINGRHRVGEVIVSGRNRDEVDSHVVEVRERLSVRGAPA